MTDPPDPALTALGWDDWFADAWRELGSPGRPGRISRLDRGWSTVLGGDAPRRVRNIGADVAVGDWVVPSDDGERIEHVLERRSAFVRRASFEGARAEADTLAANIDVVFLTHSVGSPPNQRRSSASSSWPSTAGPTPWWCSRRPTLVEDAHEARRQVAEVAVGVPVVLTSGRRGDGIEELRSFASGNRTLAFLGSSGAGKSTLVNALLGSAVQATSEVREGDQRGRHTTVAAELLPLAGEGWLVDTPASGPSACGCPGGHRAGVRRRVRPHGAVPLRDCKHDQEPGCAVQGAIAEGRLDPLASPAGTPRRRGGRAGGRAAGAGEGRRPPPRGPAGPHRRRGRARRARRRRGEAEAAAARTHDRPEGLPGAGRRAWSEPGVQRRDDARLGDGIDVDRAYTCGERLAATGEVLGDQRSGEPRRVDAQDTTSSRSP
jgi:ribosome biogenesis GTPase